MFKSVPFNYAGISKDYSTYSKSKIVMLPVAFDKTSTWMKGSRFGPKAIIEASRYMELYDMESDAELYKLGIYTAKTIKTGKSKFLNSIIKNKVKKYLGDKKFVIVLGGEHSVALGSIFAHLEQYDDLSILHLDAHADMRDEYEGNKFNHACVMARVKEKNENVVSVGIRSMDLSEVEPLKNSKLITAHQAHYDEDWILRVVSSLTKKVYITLDLDVFDPSIMPSTGTPEPGGLFWNQVMELLRNVANKCQIMGFDVVELNPSKNKAPNYLAAKLIYKLIGFIFQ